MGKELVLILYHSMNTSNQTLGTILEKTASDLLAVQLLSMTQGKLQPGLFDQ